MIENLNMHENVEQIQNEKTVQNQKDDDVDEAEVWRRLWYDRPWERGYWYNFIHNCTF